MIEIYFDFDHILFDNNHTKIFFSVYDIQYKTLVGAKPLGIRFNKVDRFIRVYDETRQLVSFGPKKYDAIYNRIRCLISQKKGITYVFFHDYARIEVDSYDSLALEKIQTLHNIIIFIISVFNKNQNHHYYIIFLEECSIQLSKNNNNK